MSNPNGRWKKGESGNPNGRPRKESTQLFEEYFHADRQLQIYIHYFKRAFKSDDVLKHLMNKFVANKQLIELLTKDQTIFDKLGINQNDPNENK